MNPKTVLRMSAGRPTSATPSAHTGSSVPNLPPIASALLLPWFLLVWLNWLRAYPLSRVELAEAVTVFGRMDPARAAATWLGHVTGALPVALLAAGAMGCGGGFHRWLSPRWEAGGSGRIALGAGLLGLAALGAGLAGLAYPSVAWTVVIVWLLPIAGQIGKLGSRIRSSTVSLFSSSLSVLLPLALLVLICLLALVGAVAPEASFDGMAHHLAHPELYAGRHRVIAVPHHFLANVPALLEMQYLFARLLTGEAHAGKLVHWGWGVLTLGLLVRWGRRTLPPGWALAAAVGCALVPYFFLVMMWSYVDLGAAGYVTLALSALSAGAPGAVLGVLCGFAAGTKLTGAFVLAIIVAALAVRRAPARTWLALGVAFLLTAGWWGAKSLGFTGNPVAPFLSAVFPTLHWSPEQHARYTHELHSYERPGGLLRLFLSPWSATVRNEGVLDSRAGIGAWGLVLFPTLAVVRVPAARLPALAALAWFVLWHFIPRQQRYLVPALPAAALAATHALRGVMERGGVTRVLGWAAVPLLVFQLGWAARLQYENLQPVGVAFGLESPREYLGRGMPGKIRSIRMREWWTVHRAGRRLLPANTYGLGMFWGPEAATQSFFDVPVLERISRASPTPERIGIRFRQLGIGWVLDDSENGFLMQAIYAPYHLTPGAANRWVQFWIGAARVAHREGESYTLYALGESAGGEPGPPPGWPGVDQMALAATDTALSRAAADGPAALAAALPAAATAYREAARTTGSPAAFERLGIVLSQIGKPAEARAALAEAERRGRRTAKLHDAVGILEANAGKMSPAANRFAEALRLDPGYVNARRNLALALSRLNRGAEAVTVLREGLVRDPSSAELRAAWQQLTGRSVP